MRRDRGEVGRSAAPALPVSMAPVRPLTPDGRPDEEAIVAAARAGDPVAMEELLGLLAPPLLRAVRALMGPSHPDLEDVAGTSRRRRVACQRTGRPGNRRQ